MSVNSPAGARAGLCLLVLGLGAAVAHAQTPVLSSISPQAVRPGETVELTLKGTNLSDPVGLLTSFPCEAVLSPDVKDNGKNKTQLVYRVTAPASVGVGVHGVRLLTQAGVSSFRLLVVDDLPSVAQQSGIQTPSSAQKLELPVAVDAALANLSRDYYRFHVEAGQRLSIEVLARRIGSSLDPMIRILDLQGREIAYSDDAPGLSSDARLCHTFQTAGDYLVEVRDIRYQGGAGYHYRLRLGDFPCVSVPVPLGAQRGSQVALQFAGPDIDGVEPVKVQVPSDPHVNSVTVGARRAGGNASGFAVLAVGDAPEFLETEPNDTPETANRVEFGASLNGRFDQPDDADYFTFTASKGQKVQFTALTRSHGSPADVVLQLVDGKGSQLAGADDVGMNDAQLTVTIPADGEYTLRVQDLLGRGGREFAYRITADNAASSFALAPQADRINIPAGGVAMMTVNVTRQGYNGPIFLSAVNLPEGVESVPTVIGPGMTSTSLTLTATDKAAAGKLSSVRIEGTSADGALKSVASLNEALKNSLGGMPWPPAVLGDDLALAIAPPSKISLRLESNEVALGRDLSTKVKIIATRAEGFDEAITLAITPARGGLPTGVTANVKPIPKGANETELVLSAAANAPLGDFTAAFTASIKQGNTTITEPVPGVLYRIADPFQFTIDAGDGRLARGGELTLKLKVDRNPAFNGPVELSFQNLPGGVSVGKITLPADKSEIEIPLKASEKAALGEVKNITVKGDGTAGKAKVSATSRNFSLTVTES